MAEQRNILRLFGTDIPGELNIRNGLREIKGISFSTSKALLQKAGIDPRKKAGEMTEEETGEIKEAIESFELPEYLSNRRKDMKHNESRQLISNDLKIQKRQDLDRIKKLGSYRGLRHRRGLPVRGQKTQSSFRGKSSVGVSTEEIRKEQSEEGE